jgi:hypothetical protein
MVVFATAQSPHHTGAFGAVLLPVHPVTDPARKHGVHVLLRHRAIPKPVHLFYTLQSS